MELKDYSTEELKKELKRRNDLAKSEKDKIKRCRMCKHWREITLMVLLLMLMLYLDLKDVVSFLKEKQVHFI